MTHLQSSEVFGTPDGTDAAAAPAQDAQGDSSKSDALPSREIK